MLAVHWWGEFQFWMSLGKILLLLSCFMFTFVTMVGGNPQHDAYGFRYWNTPVCFFTCYVWIFDALPANSILL